MATGRSIVVNGDLRSSKSTVSTLPAQRLGIRRISVGDLYRQMARQRGVTALQLNLHAELDDKIDHYVDRLQSDIAMSGERLVVDSRLAWFFFQNALKVHLITDPTVAAYRVLGRPRAALRITRRRPRHASGWLSAARASACASSTGTAPIRRGCATTIWSATAPAPRLRTSSPGSSRR
jgi:cytidylate kinase